jgi:hypothetical protein
VGLGVIFLFNKLSKEKVFCFCVNSYYSCRFLVSQPRIHVQPVLEPKRGVGRPERL